MESKRQKWVDTPWVWGGLFALFDIFVAVHYLLGWLTDIHFLLAIEPLDWKLWKSVNLYMLFYRDFYEIVFRAQIHTSPFSYFYFLLLCSFQPFIVGYVFGCIVRLVRAGLGNKHSGSLKRFDWKWFGMKLLKGMGIFMFCFVLFLLVDSFIVYPIVQRVRAADFERFLDANQELREVFEKKCGYINVKGEFVIAPSLHSAYGSGYESDFADNGLAFARVDGKVGYINEKGEFVIELEADESGDDFSNGFAVIHKNGKDRYINERGEIASGPKLADARSHSVSGLTKIAEDGKTGYINEKGEIVIAPKFHWAGDFSANGLAAVQETKNGKIGYINEKGDMVIAPKFVPVQTDRTSGKFAANGLALACIMPVR
jgi:hypothetical protein